MFFMLKGLYGKLASQANLLDDLGEVMYMLPRWIDRLLFPQYGQLVLFIAGKPLLPCISSKNSNILLQRENEQIC